MTELLKPGAPIGEEARVTVTNIAGDLDDAGAFKRAAESPFNAEEQPQEEYIDPETAAEFIKFPFEMASFALGEHWKLKDHEALMLATPSARLFSRVFGRFAGSNPDAYMLGFSLLIICAPRAVKTASLAKARLDKQAAPRQATQVIPSVFSPKPQPKAEPIHSEGSLPLSEAEYFGAGVSL